MGKKYNVFMGNQKIMDIVSDSLGYDTPQKYTYFTRDMYLTSFFYLTKRFGSHYTYDEYKLAAVWDFKVAEFDIRIELNCSWVTFMVFGGARYKNVGAIPPYWVRMRRVAGRDDRYVDIMADGERSEREKEVINTLFEDFSRIHGIDDSWTEERFHEEKVDDWFNFIDAHNEKLVGATYAEYLEKYGGTYSNALTRRAGRVLRKFLKNMLTPIYVRDVGYNIKGQCGSEYDRYVGNIEIECVNEKRLTWTDTAY